MSFERLLTAEDKIVGLLDISANALRLLSSYPKMDAKELSSVAASFYSNVAAINELLTTISVPLTALVPYEFESYQERIKLRIAQLKMEAGEARLKEAGEALSSPPAPVASPANADLPPA
ncbi:hypothetical protein PAPYR_7388 [Paratrimastix pyriformis]|uniref:Uncharacterized protein n=1 Tax=Paratrimastix pyriformis TaxID=342808 RepID=A0ABQ8UHN9_9EUKA|nr:hypothetical protein PAPYR_7388 [Paratrimastix pyriformis]